MKTTSSPTTKTLTELLQHLVSMPTLTGDHATNRAALDWVEEQLKGLPLHIKRFNPNGVPSLIATTRDTRDPKLWLAAHIDVVPGRPDQFEPVIKDDHLIGRGVVDMKFAIAVFIKLLQELGPNLGQYDLGLMLVSDEENGGTDGTEGTEWLIAKGYRGQAFFLPDNGSSWELEAGSKGLTFWKLTAQGQNAHGSRVWNGDNAIDRLYRFIEELRRQAGVPAEPCGDPAHLHHTVNLGSLHSGAVANQVPNEAEALVDIRIMPSATLDDIDAWVKAAQAKVEGVTAEAQTRMKPFTIAASEPLELFAKLAETTTGHPIPRIMSPAGSDARFIVPHNIPVINLRPTGGDSHGEAEWIDLPDLGRYYELVRQFVDTWTKR